ncbi:hypothetical protein FRIG_10135 [Frigoribacterium faeni]|uniref:hypothetical protein n=1 Tax=Frigoribacterium faeni TaxID=145483 RepID=UPI001FAD4466|nr:hypothetical protein [Frigoribacterium faeni]MCJ0701489.1 hypothetical protein [Frigoribacterium faeni]
MTDRATTAPQSSSSGEPSAAAATPAAAAPAAGTPASTFTMLGAPDAVACEGDACLLPVR